MPVFVHNSDCCRFLGTYLDHDVYRCRLSVIARYGDEGPKYSSFLNHYCGKCSRGVMSRPRRSRRLSWRWLRKGLRSQRRCDHIAHARNMVADRLPFWPHSLSGVLFTRCSFATLLASRQRIAHNCRSTKRPSCALSLPGCDTNPRSFCFAPWGL